MSVLILLDGLALGYIEVTLDILFNEIVAFTYGAVGFDVLFNEIVAFTASAIEVGCSK